MIHLLATGLAMAVLAAPGGAVSMPSPGSPPPPRQPEVDRLERPSQPLPERLDPEFIDLCLQVADDVDANLAAKLRLLRERDPEQFERRLRHTRRLIDLATLRRKDPTAYSLKLVEVRVEAEVNRLGIELRDARRDGRVGEAVSTEKQLRGMVTLQIAFEYKAREEYLCRLQDLVERLERELEQERQYFKDHLDEVIDERIERLLRRLDQAHGNAHPGGVAERVAKLVE